MIHTQLLLDAGIVIAAFGLLSHFFRRKQPAPYPPGPKGYPIIGNLLDMPTELPWRTYMQWGQKFGDIVHVNVVGKHIVILNSAKQAAALLNKKSGITATRPRLEMASELVGWKNAMAMAPYGHRFREYRRYFHMTMGSKSLVERHHELMMEENRKFLRRVLSSKEDIGIEIRKNAGAIILKLAYGYYIKEENDSIVHLVEQAMDTLAAGTTPGAWFVDYIPILRFVPSWFPGGGFKKRASHMKELVLDMAAVPYELTKHKIANNAELPPNLISDCLDTNAENLDTETEYNIKWAAASIYSGGADTTVSAIHSFILAMTLYPDIQKRAQAEIDQVIGNDRFPTFEDRPHLPYVEAVVKEIFRWKPLAPTTLPHLMMEDIIYEGYYIPKGTSVFANIWAVFHDPETYPNPEVFDPMRHVTETGEPRAHDGPNVYDVCFGYGRRICPGMHFADASVFIWCAMILSVYDISKASENGKLVEPIDSYTTGAVSHPRPFKYAIAPRNDKAKHLILSSDN